MCLQHRFCCLLVACIDDRDRKHAAGLELMVYSHNQSPNTRVIIISGAYCTETHVNSQVLLCHSHDIWPKQTGCRYLLLPLALSSNETAAVAGVQHLPSIYLGCLTCCGVTVAGKPRCLQEARRAFGGSASSAGSWSLLTCLPQASSGRQAVP